MKKILITGSSGFIGKYFINKYKNKYNIETFSFFNGNVNQIDFEHIDVIFHLSALVHQMGGATVEEYEEVNVIQSVSLAKKAKELGVKHFIFMSTVKVYGEETEKEYTENTICNPQDEYGISKLKAEQKLESLASTNFVVSIIRTPIVYGYGVKANIKSLINLVNKISYLPFSNINNKRSMVYIGNLCHLVDEVICQVQPGIYLSSDDKPLSTTQFIELIAQCLNKKVHLVKVPLFETLLRVLKPSFHKRLYGSLEVNNTITQRKLNLINPYSVEEGIKLMIVGEKK